jgi:TM2 domain-containing membrane protein YozV
VSKYLVSLAIYILLITFGQAQEEENNSQASDSITTSLKKEGISVVDTLKAKKRAINPLAPSKAAFYSAVFPGLGQIYNKRYWKVPLVYAIIGGGIYGYIYNDDLYDRFRTAFKRRQAGFTDDEFYDLGTPNPPGADPDFSVAALESAQKRYQEDRDLWLLVTIGMYALNIVDANVDSHLKQFNVDDDLSMDFKPYLDLDAITAKPVYGMALTIKF